MKRATPLLTIGAELGEGPIWVDGVLWFVDIKSRHIYRHDPTSVATDRWECPEFVGWIVPSTKGDFIVGLQSGPHRFSPDTGEFARIATIDADMPANRLNDAAVDPQGRLYFGTMDNEEAAATGRVHILDQGNIRASSIAGTIITNGPAITPGGDRLYHVDTLGKKIYVHCILPNGELGAGHEFLRFGEAHGYPDGAICDSEGGLWVGFYGGWAARRYDADGQLTDEVHFPVANVTKIALGGPDGRTACATTARQGLSAEQLAVQPLAGDVFSFPVDVPAMQRYKANS